VPLITSYLYQNIFTVQLLDYGNVAIQNIRNRVVYQRPIEIYRGADNPITVKFKNQDQKAANISNSTFQGFISNYIDGNIVANVSVTVSNVQTATASCTITSSMLEILPQNKYKLIFLQSVAGLNTPVYSDDNFSIYAELNINPAYNF
jgi:uncharacterized membrane protein